MKRHYPEIALHVPTLLLPRSDVPLRSWSVIACDQHTSQPQYWRETERLVGDNPSTLGLVLPEARLGGDRAAAIAAINQRMAEYLAAGVFVEQAPGFMLVEREVRRETPRRGLLVALDLECYDYRPEARTLIRSTEGTDPKRLPARIDVRRDAPLESPHILVLIDDPERRVIEPLFDQVGQPCYDFELMQDGGRLRGWHIAEAETIDATAQAIAGLRRGEPPLVYAMGDGNHSFAAARSVWEQLKADGAPADHPARYALAELVNVHDDALRFEPIHRLLDGVDAEDVLAAFTAHFAAAGGSRRRLATRDDWRQAWREVRRTPGHHIPYLTASESGVLSVAAPRTQLEIATLQAFLDRVVAAHAGADIDYVHGEEALIELVDASSRIGFLLPSLDEGDMFQSVVRDGALPRKTFSLGEAHEKRYYMECRRITPEAGR